MVAPPPWWGRGGGQYFFVTMIVTSHPKVYRDSLILILCYTCLYSTCLLVSPITLTRPNAVKLAFLGVYNPCVKNICPLVRFVCFCIRLFNLHLTCTPLNQFHILTCLISLYSMCVYHHSFFRTEIGLIWSIPKRIVTKWSSYKIGLAWPSNYYFMLWAPSKAKFMCAFFGTYSYMVMEKVL